MKVRALKSFGSAGVVNSVHYSAGDVFELPDGVDWLRVGLVEVVETKPPAKRRTKATSQKADTRENRG